MRRATLLAVLLAVAIAGWLASPHLAPLLGLGGETPPAGSTAVVGQAAAPAERLTQVRVRRSEAEPMARQQVLNGRTQANRSVRVAAEVPGEVIEIVGEKGDQVAEGDLLARLDPRDRAAALAEARATLEQRRIEAEAAERLGQRGFQAETQVAGARAALEQARYQVRRSEVALEQTSITAPFAGVLEERPIELGSFLEVGDTVGTLVELDPLLVVTDVPEAAILSIVPGSTAEVKFIDGTVREGRVRFVARQANAATRSFRVEIVLPNPDLRIPAGISTTVAINLAPVPAHAVSPGILVLDDRGVLGVKSVDDDGKVAFHPAEIVRAEGDVVWLAGLPSTIDLITVGQGFVMPGQPVEAVPEATVAALVAGGEPGDTPGTPR
ncbi:MAG: efflux RND transporter periplasmic adaptor subunit [Geminicoccaceae bacterium]|nr:efflux RND transporter periplasmic adaptor subunit [Geminicoccaceae bacterium]